MKVNWFSVMLRFAVLVEGLGTTDISRSLVVVRAHDYDEAARRGLATGRHMERTYINGDQREVRWRLIELETVDQLGEQITDGQEIYAEPQVPGSSEAFTFEALFKPEESQPGQSGV